MAGRSIIRTEAIVLRSLNYGETSQIVTLFTQKKGKITVMAKGARRPDSSFGASLQPMAHTEVVFYYKPTRDLQTLSESAHVELFHGLSRDLEKIGLGLRIVELVYALLETEDAHPAVFALTQQALRRLDAASARAANLWPYFQLRLAAALGVAPSIDRQAVASLPDAAGVLALESGAVGPPDTPAEAAERAPRAVLRAFAVFARADLDDVMRMRLSDAQLRQVNTLVEHYMRYQFDASYPTTSRDVIHRLNELAAPSSDSPS